MDGLSLDNPWAWEQLCADTPREDLIARLRLETAPMAAVRLGELLSQPGGTQEQLYEGTELLKRQAHPLAQALLISAFARLRLWHEAYALVSNWRLPMRGDPLMQEASLIVALYGSMAARTMKDTHLATRLLGRAETLHDILGLMAREIMLLGEAERVNTLEGRGNPGAIREILRRNLNYMQRQHNTHNLAESLAARGQYTEAKAALMDADPTDHRAMGMRAFYGVMIGEGLVDPGGNDDYLRLARTAQGFRTGNFELGYLQCTHEPQATYAAMLTASALARSPTAQQRRLFPTLPIPAPHDQQIWWIINRIGMLARGIQIEDAHRIYEVWHSALAGLWNLADILTPTSTGYYGDILVLLAAIPGAPDHILHLREQLPVLIGDRIIYRGEEMDAPGRIGSVMVAEAAQPNMPHVTPLYRSEPGRWTKRENELLRAGMIPFAPVNPGPSIRAALAIRNALRDHGQDTTEADAVLDKLLSELSVDCRALVYPCIKGGEHETSPDHAAQPERNSAALDGTGRSLPGLPDDPAALVGTNPHSAPPAHSLTN